MNQELHEAVDQILAQECSEVPDEIDELFWDTLILFQQSAFYTAKNLEFFYWIKGNEMFVNRKNKSITRATAVLAFHTALDLQRCGEKITGPKKLGTFGASYLYPVFIAIGVIKGDMTK